MFDIELKFKLDITLELEHFTFIVKLSSNIHYLTKLNTLTVQSIFLLQKNINEYSKSINLRIIFDIAPNQ